MSLHSIWQTLMYQIIICFVAHLTSVISSPSWWITSAEWSSFCHSQDITKS